MKPVSQLLRARDGTLWHARPDDTVFEALQLRAEYEVGALMVMDQGKLVGVLSERDYTRKIALQGRSSKDTRVKDIMTRDVLYVTPQTTTATAVAVEAVVAWTYFTPCISLLISGAARKNSTAITMPRMNICWNTVAYCSREPAPASCDAAPPEAIAAIRPAT